MKKLKELENDLSKIWDILLMAKESFMYSKYLYYPNSKIEQDYLTNARDFHFIRFVLWRSSIIELSKLFGDKSVDKFNFNKFLNKLKTDGYFGDLYEDKVQITKWETDILAESAVIKKIVTLRDKLYSHTDSNFVPDSTYDLLFVDIEKLIKISEEIIVGIFDQVFDTLADTSNIYFDMNRFNLVRILAEEKERKMQEFIKNIREK